jgi:8-oxo-dGTP pyrophosphatase MutT (NUDIX family)
MVLVVGDRNPAKPAATVILLRDSSAGPEVFMVKRHEGTPFMAGAYVFPGGRVDAGDHDVASAEWCDGLEQARAAMRDLDAAAALAFHVAAARELFEEAGVLLARDRDAQFVSLADAGEHERFKAFRHDVHSGGQALRQIVERERLRLALDALAPYAHWVTPPVDTRRFDTRFFLARVPPQQTPAHDETETTHSVWTTAAAAIQAARRMDIILPPPTWMTLEELATYRSVDAALQDARLRQIVRREPAMLDDEGRRMLVMPDAAFSRETCFVWTTDRWLPE